MTTHRQRRNRIEIECDVSVEILQALPSPACAGRIHDRGIVGVADLERALRDFDLELRQSIACFQQSFLAGVLHQVRGSAACAVTARLRRFRQGRGANIFDRRICDRDRRDVIVRGQLP
jgi:hypothetical protein